MGQEFALKLLFDQSQEAETGAEDTSDESLRARLQFHLDCTGHSLSYISERIKGVYGGAAIRKFLARDSSSYSYHDNFTEGIRKELISYLQREEDPSLPLENPLFCETSVAVKMAAVCACCKRDADMGIIIGASGLGKSEYLKEMKRRDRGAIMVTGDPTVRSLGAILLLISKLLPGVSRNSCTNAAFMMNIIDSLRGSGRLLVIDEAHWLSWEAFEAVRRIYDATGIGVIFVGQQRMYDEMRGGSRKSLLWDQIFSRVGLRAHFKGNLPMEDVLMLVDKICPGLDKQSMGYLYEKANGPGKFRSMVKLLNRARCLAEAENTKVTLPLLQQVNRILMS